MPSSFVRFAVLIAVALLALPAGAQETLPVHAGIHILTVGPDGELLCDEASEVQAQGLHDATATQTGQSVRLTPLPSLNAAGVSDFRIVLRATDQLLARPEALLSFRRSAARWERIIQDGITTVIDVDYGPERFGTPYDANVLGSTNSALLFAGSTTGTADMVQRLKNTAATAQETALYEAIPVPTPTTAGEGTLNRGIGGLIPLQVLGYQPIFISETTPFGTVPSIGFNDAFPYDFDPTDGVDSDKTDFEGVAIHEIGHALGFTSAIGISAGTNDPLFAPWDLFRVRPEAVAAGESLTDGVGFETADRVLTPGPPNTEVLVVENGQTYYEPVQVFFDGPAVFEVSTATGSRQGGDGQQASHWRDDALRPPSLGADRKIGIMDPNLGRGSRDELTFADVRMLDVIGYTVVYDPPTATIALSIDGQAVDDRFLITEPIDLGDVAAGMTRDVPLVIGNGDAATALDFLAEAEVTNVFPVGSATPTFTVVSGSGSVEPDGSTTRQLRIGGLDGQAIVRGTVRIRSNDDDRGVIEVPVTFSTGGAVAPELTVGNVPTSLGDLGPDEQRTVDISVANAGTFDLSYRIVTGLAARSFGFPETTENARTAPPIFTADFEGADPLAPFTYNEASAPDRWQTRTTGPAALPGHSTPTALYFGDASGGDTYSDNSVGLIRTPAFDLSDASADSRVTLSFATYLQAEAGFDFATVLVTLDGGQSFEELASSDGGILRNTDDGWETVTLDVSGVASFPQPIAFAFRFESDDSVTDAGWYLDDVVVNVAPGEAPFYVTPLAGVLEGDTQIDLSLTANATSLETGFYRGSVEIRTDQPGDDPDPFLIDFTVGGPTLPTVAATEPIPAYYVPGGTVSEVTLTLQNEGDATLSYVRVLEPATSRFELGGTPALGHAPFDGLAARGTAVSESDGVTAPAAQAGAQDDGDVLGAVSFGTAPRFYDLAQLANGDVVVFDGASSATTTAYRLARDLMSQPDTFGPSALGATVTGAAYNPQTGSLWIALFEEAVLAEVTLTDGQIVRTGREVDLDFTPFGVDYSPELDAFVIGSYQTSGVLVVTVDGDLMPGYPAFVTGREIGEGATSLPGVSFTQGLLEMTGAPSELLPRDQFGAGYGDASFVFSSEVLGSSIGVYGLLRDRLDPDGSFFVTTRPNPSSGASARLVRIDPPDLPAVVGTRVFAGAPLFADRSIAPRETFDVVLELDGSDLDAGEQMDELAFLTNNPDTPVVRFPLTLSVSPVASEADEAAAFALTGVDPNPVRGAGRVRFALASAGDVSVTVFDALGRRVAVLAHAPLAAGTHELPFPAASLAPGVYVVRLVAGTEQATRTVTVVR